MQTFTIDKVGWHTQVKGNPETRDAIERRFALIAEFLDTNGLSKTTLAAAQYPDEYSIRSDDLTDEGLEFMKLAYDAWLKSIKRRKTKFDTSLLEKKLAKFRVAD